MTEVAPVTLNNGDTFQYVDHIYVHSGPTITVTDTDQLGDKLIPLHEHHKRIRAAVQKQEEENRRRQEEQDRSFHEMIATMKKHPEFLTALQRWHDAIEYDCAAYSEGQECCVDKILEGLT